TPGLSMSAIGSRASSTDSRPSPTSPATTIAGGRTPGATSRSASAEGSPSPKYRWRSESRRSVDNSPGEAETQHRAVLAGEEVVPVFGSVLVEGVVAEEVAGLDEEPLLRLPAEGPRYVGDGARGVDRTAFVLPVPPVVGPEAVSPKVERPFRTEVEEPAQAEDRQREGLSVEVLARLVPQAGG